MLMGSGLVLLRLACYCDHNAEKHLLFRLIRLVQRPLLWFFFCSLVECFVCRVVLGSPKCVEYAMRMRLTKENNSEKARIFQLET